MKRINNKGFAISSLLYGLTLMIFLITFALMSTMGVTRKNTRTLVDAIDDELNRYGLTDQHMEYDSSIDTEDQGRLYIVQSDGYYNIELYGAKQNKTSTSEWPASLSAEYKNGSYISGTIYLKENDFLYIHLGRSDSINEQTNSYITYGEDEEERKIMEAPGGNGDTFKNNENNNIIIDREYTAVGYAGTDVTENGDTINNNLKINDKPLKFLDVKYMRYVNSGLGKVVITKAEAPTRTNSALNQVKYIKDCVKKSDKNDYVAWAEIQAIDTTGRNIAKGKTPSVVGNIESPGGNISKITDGKLKIADDNTLHYFAKNPDTSKEVCMKISFDAEHDLNEVAVWHYYTDARKYKDHDLSVSSDGTSWTTIKSSDYTEHGSSTTDHSEVETSDGIHISAFQPQEAKDGVYIIRQNYEYTKNKVLTYNNGSAGFLLFNGGNNQKWEIKYSDSPNEGMKKFTMKNREHKCYLGVTNGNVVCSSNKYEWERSSTTRSGVKPYVEIYDKYNESAASNALTNSVKVATYSTLSYDQFLFIKVNK